MKRTDCPSVQDIINERTKAGLTMKQSAALLHTTTNSWQKWEYGSSQMHPAFWELFLRKVDESA